MGSAGIRRTTGGEQKDDTAGDERGEADGKKGTLLEWSGRMEEERGEMHQNEEPTDCPEAHHSGCALLVSRGEQQDEAANDENV
jgi:hypothetical protein